MEKLKVITHTVHTYETSDGKVFDDKKEAVNWQKKLVLFEDICMLNSNEQPTKEVDKAIFVRIDTMEQAEVFNDMLQDVSYCSSIPDTGFWVYDDISDSYINVKEELNKFQHIINILSKGD